MVKAEEYPNEPDACNSLRLSDEGLQNMRYNVSEQLKMDGLSTMKITMRKSSVKVTLKKLYTLMEFEMWLTVSSQICDKFALYQRYMHETKTFQKRKIVTVPQAQYTL